MTTHNIYDLPQHEQEAIRLELFTEPIPVERNLADEAKLARAISMFKSFGRIHD